MSLGHGDFFNYGRGRAYRAEQDDYWPDNPSLNNPVYTAMLARAYASTTGSAWYRANSTTYSMPNSRCDGDSNRWSKNVGSSWNDLGYEVVVYLKPESSSMTSDGHVGLKHWGPNHTPPCGYTKDGKCCCWYDCGVRENGDVVVQIEYPHPKNITKWRSGNIGRHIDNGKMIGFRWYIRKDSGYHNRRIMGWVDTSGGRNYSWRQIYNILDTGQIMPHHYGAPSDQEIEIRISDIPCGKIHMQYGPYCRKMT